MEELKDKSKRVIENIGEKKGDMIQKWEEKSRDLIDAFLLLFGRDGRLVRIKKFSSRFYFAVLFNNNILIRCINMLHRIVFLLRQSTLLSIS